MIGGIAGRRFQHCKPSLPVSVGCLRLIICNSFSVSEKPHCVHLSHGLRLIYRAAHHEADWALSPLFASQNWPPTLFNTAFYSNKQVDDFLAQALKTNDPAEKTRLYKAAQDIIWQESPWIPLVVEKLVSAHSKNLTGFWIMPDTGFSFEDADLQ